VDAYRLVPDQEISRGRLRSFRALARHQELGVQVDGEEFLTVFHLSDVQLADVKSPARYEWANSRASDPAFAPLVPAYRPQEMLVASALVEMVRTINRLGEGARRPIALITGDGIDNAQTNELEALVAALSGGVVQVASGSDAPECVAVIGDDRYWHPGPGDDLFKREFGFPVVEGLVEHALSALVSPGLAMDWYVANGNHELLVQGVGLTDEATRAIAVGDIKQLDPREPLPGAPGELGRINPSALMTGGPSIEVASDARRGFVDRRAIWEALRRAPGTPAGHGLDDAERLYYATEVSPEVVLVVLDTAVSWGGAAGAIDGVQARWLTETLDRYSSARFNAEGTLVATGGEDRLIVVAAHHPSDELDNDIARSRSDYHDGAWLARELLATPNVVAFLNGHTHRHRIVLHERLGHQLVEITTGALMDWPCEARRVALHRSSDELLIGSEIVSFDGPVVPGNDLDQAALASWHRVLAANAQLPGHGILGDDASHRNRVVRLPLPRWLRG
jgi:hypothetical protein